MKESSKIRHIASILAFVFLFQYLSMIIPFIEESHAYECNYNGVTFSYDLDSNGNAVNVRITSEQIMTGEKEIKFPSSLDEHSVVSIGSNAIPSSGTLSYGIEIIIPEGVVKIGRYAFI